MITLRKRLGSLPFTLANLTVSAPEGRAIFVTGNGRSGTSWIGQTLGRADGILYYHEPCHPARNGFRGSREDPLWCRYLRPGEHDAFFDFALGAAFRGHFWRGSGHSYADYRGRIGTRPRILVKDIAAFLSTEWVADRWDPQVLIVLRHPGAYAASVANLRQDAAEIARLRLLCVALHLRRGPLAPHLERLSAIEDPLEAVAASWAIRTSVVLAAQARHPDWILVRYEELAADPVLGFRDLYSRLDLPWSEELADWIRSKTSSQEQGAYSTSRVSRQRIDAWRAQLSAEEARRVREVIARFQLPIYAADADWDGPYRSDG